MFSLHFLDPLPGGAPAVLLLHGLGADGGSWALQLPALAQAGYRPLAPDTPGFGRSPYDGRGWNIRRMAKQFAGLVEQLGAGPVHVVGLSMGGVIAQQFALDFPHLTRKLVLVSTFSVLRPEDWSGWAYFLSRTLTVLTRGLNAQARLVAERLFPEPQQAELRDLLIATISNADPRAYRLAMRSLGLFDSRRRLAALRLPALVLTGANDSTVSPHRQQQLAAALPNARHVSFPNAGHALPIDQPEAFNRLLLEFLAS